MTRSVYPGENTHRGISTIPSAQHKAMHRRRPHFCERWPTTVPPQTQTQASAIWDIVFSGEADKLKLRYALGLYNAADAKYYVPVSREFLQTTIIQNGRTLMASAQVSF